MTEFVQRAAVPNEVCRIVDEEQMKLAEGYEIPDHLSQLLEQARRTMNHASAT